MTGNPYCQVDPSLPDVLDADVHCCHCGQSLQTICDGAPGLPERHYVKPTKSSHSPSDTSAHIRSSASGHRNPNLCPIDRDRLSVLIYRAQRIKAGLSLTLELRKGIP